MWRELLGLSFFLLVPLSVVCRIWTYDPQLNTPSELIKSKPGTARPKRRKKRASSQRRPGPGWCVTAKRTPKLPRLPSVNILEIRSRQRTNGFETSLYTTSNRAVLVLSKYIRWAMSVSMCTAMKQSKQMFSNLCGVPQKTPRSPRLLRNLQSEVGSLTVVCVWPIVGRSHHVTPSWQAIFYHLRQQRMNDGACHCATRMVAKREPIVHEWSHDIAGHEDI